MEFQLINAKYTPCKYKNRYTFSDIYFNKGRVYQNANLKENELLNNCHLDELLLSIKVNITYRL